MLRSIVIGKPGPDPLSCWAQKNMHHMHCKRSNVNLALCACAASVHECTVSRREHERWMVKHCDAVQTRCDLKPFVHFEMESVRSDSHRMFIKFQSNLCYIMNKYELHLTFRIIFTSPTPDRDWDGAAACRAKPLVAGASSTRDFFF